MNKYMKISIFFAATSFVASTAIMATAARSAGMGINQANSWAVEGQLPYIYTNPAAMGTFSPMFFGETGIAANSTNGGILFQPIPILNIGVFAGQSVDVTEINKIYTNGASAVSSTALTAILPLLVGPTLAGGSIFTNVAGLTNQNASLILQLKLDKMAFGAGFSYGEKSTKNTYKKTLPTPVLDESLSISDSSINAVVGAALDLDTFKLDASVAYRTANVNNVYTFKDTTNTIDTTASYKSNGAGDILIDVQGILSLGNNNLHIMGGYDILNASSIASYSLTTTAGTSTVEDKYKDTGSQIRAGFSDEIRISKDIFAFVGASLLVLNEINPDHTWTAVSAGVTTTNTTVTDLKTVTKTTTVTLPIFMGMEANLSPSWQARFGLGANLLSGNTTGSTDNTSSKPAPAISNGTTNSAWNNAAPSFATGLSFKLSNFSFDWDIKIPLLLNGPSFIGGTAALTGLASAFAVSYKFGEVPADKK